MELKIALAGNPNSGKTTLFNALTGSNQFVGNWPGVTVEKKEGKLKKNDDVIIVDLPGIYSLSPYTLEEVVARNYLIGERPDAILNIIDGTNLERNLYLTTQLSELGIPMVAAVNMIDIVEKNGDKLDIDELSRRLGCKVVSISALKGTSIIEAAEAAIYAAKNDKFVPHHIFSGPVEHALAHIEEACVHSMPEEQQRWYAIKVFERDIKVLETLKMEESLQYHIEQDIAAAEKELDDDSESIIINERYLYISSVIERCYKKKNAGKPSVSDKIDRVVTNRWLGLPIFAVIMFIVYYVSMVGVGAASSEWANNRLFGNGWHLFGIGSDEYNDAAEKYGDTDEIIKAFVSEFGTEEDKNATDVNSADFDRENAKATLQRVLNSTPQNASITYFTQEEGTFKSVKHTKTLKSDFEKAISLYENTDFKKSYGMPQSSDYGVWVPGIPVLIEKLLNKIGTAKWLNSLILDGIVSGVGSVLGFVPQLLILFFFLAFLESCGYMSRIAFELDRLFRKFGLSGKSFIPLLVGVGCSVPGIMASRTIENQRDRRMTVITTSFIPCGAKVPLIAMISGAVFGGSPIIATSAYFIGMAAVVISGLILKKLPMFAGDPAPFVMELPAYHMPTAFNLLQSVWERGWSFIKKAGTVILLSAVIIWFMTNFGFSHGRFGLLSENEFNSSILAAIGIVISKLFAPLGWGTWQAAVASLTGLIAKENIVGTLGVLYGKGGQPVYSVLGSVFNGVTGYSFMVFNLLCAPCVAAVSAIAREMKSWKWTVFAIGYQCFFAYTVSLMINQFGSALAGKVNIGGLIVAFVLLCVILFMLFVKKEKVKAK